MAIDSAELLKNYRTKITMVRGKKYTFNVNTRLSESEEHPFFITTNASGGTFEGAVTEGVKISNELLSDPAFETNPSTSTDWTITGSWIYNSSINNLVINGVGSAGRQGSLARYTHPNIRIGRYYKIEYDYEISQGTIRLKCGNTLGTLKSSGTTQIDTLRCLGSLTVSNETGSPVTTLNNLGQPGTISVVTSPNFIGKLGGISIKEVGVVEGIYEFTPSYEHPDTLYYQCGMHPDMGGEIELINSPGLPLNDLEWWYTLGINQSNRTYPPTTKADPLIVNKLISAGLPAGVFKNIFNRPPTGTVTSDRPYSQYYDVPSDDRLVTLSGLISDPEKDILKYKWKHFSPKQTLDGASLLTTFVDDTKLETVAALVKPPTDMIYTLHLEVSDSDNITTIPLNIKVSGTIPFDDWDVGLSGLNEFDLGDSNVPFDDLD